MIIYFYIFFIALTLNFFWEQAHSLLYVSYKGGAITEYILFHAALFDATVITITAYFFLTLTYFKQRLWVIVPVLIIFASALEIWALETSRWVSTETMPIIPLLNVGLTPTIQLGLLGYITVLISQKLK